MIDLIYEYTYCIRYTWAYVCNIIRVRRIVPVKSVHHGLAPRSKALEPMQLTPLMHVKKLRVYVISLYSTSFNSKCTTAMSLTPSVRWSDNWDILLTSSSLHIICHRVYTQPAPHAETNHTHNVMPIDPIHTEHSGKSLPRVSRSLSHHKVSITSLSYGE